MLKEIQVPAQFIDFCRDWHNGQSSMFYAISSTGNLTPNDFSPMSEDDTQVDIFHSLTCEIHRLCELMSQKADNFKSEHIELAYDFQEWAEQTYEKLEDLYIEKYGDD